MPRLRRQEWTQAMSTVLIPMDVDNTGEPYICRVPLLWIQHPRSTEPLSPPQWTTREHFEEMHRNWAKLHRPRAAQPESRPPAESGGGKT